MFETEKLFNGIFGKIAPGMCRLTMNGGIAVKCSKGYKTYNLVKDTLTNVTNFCLNIGDEMFFVMPTSKVDHGDIILVDGRPKCVLKADTHRIEVIDYETSEVKTVVPERHVFLGNAYYYGKIVSLFGGSFKKGKGLNNIMKLMMMSSLLGGNSNVLGGTNSTGGLGQLAMMSMFMNGNDNPFEEMFNGLSFDALTDSDEDDEEEKTEA